MTLLTQDVQEKEKKAEEEFGFATLAIHSGQIPDPTTGAVSPPIYQTTTYAQEAVGENKGYTYSRTGNPTVSALEENLAKLERGAGCACFSSGMAAITAVFSLLSQGDHAVISEVVYGGTPRLCNNILSRFGIEFSYVDTSDIDAIRKSIRENTKFVFVETPANPTLKLADIEELSKVRKRGSDVKLVVDNTFSTPALQVPIGLGADIVIHSTTKFIEGHNTTIGGAVISKDKEVHEQVKYIQNATGSILSPFNAWLTLRGLKTLELRMKRHGENAQLVAEFLEDHPNVTRVLYPGLASFPQAKLAEKQYSRAAGFGGMLAFELEGGVDAGLRFAKSLSLIALAENLGAVETMVTHPASMTHAAMSKEAREKAGITDGLIRVSVGLEDPKDIIQDLDRAIKVASL